MTKPTPAQIEAAAGAMKRQCIASLPMLHKLAFAALTAAAEVKPEVIFQSMPDGSTAVLPLPQTDAEKRAAEVGERVPLSQIMLDEVRAETIERCAQVADHHADVAYSMEHKMLCEKIATAIRALKDK